MSVGIPGKIIIEAFTLINNYGASNETRSDVRPLVVGTSIYENIFYDYMFGVSKFRDSYNLYATLPITTDTYVYIRLRDPFIGNNVEGLYKVYKVSNVRQETTKIQSYVVHFVSVEMFNARRVRVNKRITGNIPGAIEEIHRSISHKKLDIDKDSSKTNLYIPMMTADRAISFLVKNAKWGAILPDYTYWETFRGFNCRSLSCCTMTSTVHEFSTSCQLSRDLYEDDFKYDDFIKIDEYKARNTFDSARMLYGGYDGATVFSYDPISGTSYFDALGDEPLSCVYCFQDQAVDYTALSKRNQLLQQLANTYYYISVPGLLSRSSGDMANVTIYTGNNMDEKDTTLSGKRLICGIVHIIADDAYNQHITLGNYYLGDSASHK